MSVPDTNEAIVRIVAGGLIAILRLGRTDDLMPAVEALREGGVTAIEVTPATPGAFTATEIVQAWTLGASMVKVFPVASAGAGYIEEILFTLPDVRLVPTGGISLQNVGDFIRAGAAAVGVGDEMVPKDLLAQGEFSEITRRAQAFVEAVQRARGQVGRREQIVRPIEGPDVR